MRHLILTLLLLTSSEVFAQVITGRVLDAKTSLPIARASVYIEGSFRTAISDSTGYFSLYTGVSNHVPIVVSCVGYSSLKISGYSTPLKITLEPKTYQIGEVVVVDDGMSYVDKLTIFKMEFLGVSLMASTCIIENEDDLVFRYDRSKKSIEVISAKPIIIYNKELGYRVNYFLESFVVVKGRTVLNGSAKFEDNLATSVKDSAKIIDNRKEAFQASRMFFIRSIWNNELEKNNFELYNLNGKRLFANDLIVVKDKSKYLRVPYPIKIIRHGVESILMGQSRYTRSYIDKNGYYDADELIWNGAMATQRVGDLLPFEY